MVPRVLRVAWIAVALTLPASAPSTAARNEAPVSAAAENFELVVVEVAGCVYCEVLRRDALPVFEASSQAREVHLRFLDIDAPAARLLELDAPLTTVPTVLLLDGRREVARAEGYMGPDGFMRAIAWMRGHGP